VEARPQPSRNKNFVRCVDELIEPRRWFAAERQQPVAVIHAVSAAGTPKRSPAAPTVASGVNAPSSFEETNLVLAAREPAAANVAHQIGGLSFVMATSSDTNRSASPKFNE
jgi:hypothetical protein